MKSIHLVVALFIVIALSAGQLLFKLSASAYQQGEGLMSVEALTYVGIGLTIYAVATVAWIWLLQFLPLSIAYPVMALAFVIVPFGSAFFLGESLSARTVIGALLIVVGVAISAT